MKRSVKSSVNPLFQIALLLLSIPLLFIIFYNPIFGVKFFEKMPEFQPSSELKADPQHTIRVSFYLQDFYNMDIVRNDLSLSGVVWFNFDPSIIDLQRIGQFAVTNGNIDKKSKPIITEHPDGRVTAQYSIFARFSPDLIYKAYPFNNHILSVIFTNPSLTKSSPIFVTSDEDFAYKHDLFIPGCTLRDKHASAGIDTHLKNFSQDMQIPVAVFSIDCDRIDLHNFTNVFLPLWLIFFLGLFIFSLDPISQRATIVMIAMSGIPALLAYRFIVENFAPHVGMLIYSDYFFFLFLFLQLLIFVAALSMLDSSLRTKKLVIIALYVLMLIGSIWVVHDLYAAKIYVSDPATESAIHKIFRSFADYLMS